MAEFSGKVVSAVFVDTEYSIIKVRYEDNDGNLSAYHLEVDQDHPDYQALLAEGWDTDKIIDETAEEKRAQSAAFNTEVQYAARLLAQEMVNAGSLEDEIRARERKLLELDQTLQSKTKSIDADLFSHIFEENSNKEELFKCKLWALELEEIKNADKTIKSSIRKSTRITQVLGIVDSLLN